MLRQHTQEIADMLNMTLLTAKKDQTPRTSTLSEEEKEYCQHMQAFSVEKMKWTAHLCSLLQGEALDTYLAIPQKT